MAGGVRVEWSGVEWSGERDGWRSERRINNYVVNSCLNSNSNSNSTSIV